MLIQDVTPPPQKAPVSIREFTSDQLICELYRRGVDTDRVFGLYYELAAIDAHRDEQVFGSDEEGLHGK